MKIFREGQGALRGAGRKGGGRGCRRGNVTALVSESGRIRTQALAAAGGQGHPASCRPRGAAGRGPTEDVAAQLAEDEKSKPLTGRSRVSVQNQK